MYHLFAKPTGEYEIVPTGWSLLVALTGPFWAIGNGLFVRYALYTFLIIPPAIAAFAIGQYLPSIGVLMLLAAGYLVAFYYIPSVAFSWREELLLSRGYELRARIRARSSKEALKRYAEEEV